MGWWNWAKMWRVVEMYLANAWAMMLGEAGESNPGRGNAMCLNFKCRAAQHVWRTEKATWHQVETGRSQIIESCKHVEDCGPHPMWNDTPLNSLRRNDICNVLSKIMMATTWRMNWRRQWVEKAAGKLLLFSIVMVQCNRKYYIDLGQGSSSINGEKWLNTRWLWVIRAR